MQLRTLNPQVQQVRAEVLRLPADATAICDSELQGGANSFGWSGIIAHGIVARWTLPLSPETVTQSHAYSIHRQRARRVRREQTGRISRAPRICLLSNHHDPMLSCQGLVDDAIITGTLKSPATALFS